MRVAEIMQKDVATLHPEDALDLAHCMMKLGRFRHLPVISAGGELVGLVTRGVLLRYSISCKLELGETTEREWLSGIRADEVMVRDLITVTPDADLLDVVDAMVTRRIGCVPVSREGRLVGLVTKTECLTQLRGLLAERRGELEAMPAGLKRFRRVTDLGPESSVPPPQPVSPERRTPRGA